MTIQESGRKALLIRGQFDSGDLNFWTGHGSVIWDGVTYRGAGQIMRITGNAATTGSRLSGLTVEISGVDAEAIAISEVEPFQRRRVTIYLAAADENWQIAEVSVFFDGLADNIDTSDDPAAPSLTLALEPRALDLRRVRPVRYLPEDQRSRYSGDTFFDQVAVIQNQELTIGKN